METPTVNREGLTPDTGYAPMSVIGEHYRVERELGHGGMATVYLCTDLRDEKLVAIKILRHELGSAVVIERFLREIAFASELDHPQIPKVLGSGVIDGLPYYVMTYINGESLKKRIMREAQLAIPDALKIMCEVIEPTAYAHKRGIVHRDLKPDNILLADDGVFVLDFGIARAIVESGGDKLTSTGIGVGTPSYMSPEQALGDRALDVRSDVYSLGCVLYEMLAGIPPFVGPTAQVIISRRFAAPPPPLREVRDNVPEAVEEAISKALAKAPADRWPNVTAFGNALKACANETGARPAIRAFGLRKSTLTRAAIGVAFVALASIGILAWTRGRRSAFEKSEDAIRSWDFGTAINNLQNAVATDRRDARAQLWLAQSLMLNGASAEEWKTYALFANSNQTALDSTERVRASALASMAVENYADACAKFSKAARQAGSGDFTASLAWADCLRSDSTVLPDKNSPSGYRFQSSRQLADSIYGQLLDKNSESSRAYGVVVPRLESILPVTNTALRFGRINSQRRIFAAAPSLSGDTIAYTPYPRLLQASWRLADASAIEAAVNRNRDRLRSLGLDWIRIAPDDPESHALLARVLASTGELQGNKPSALQQIEIARKLSTENNRDTTNHYLTAIRLGRYEVELLVRSGQFAKAGIVSDSILGWQVPSTLDESDKDNVVDILTSLAALRGKPSIVEGFIRGSVQRSLVRLPSGEIKTLSPALGLEMETLLNYSEFGGPVDSIKTSLSRLSERIGVLVPADQLEDMRYAILSRPLILASPAIGAAPIASLMPTGDIVTSVFQKLGRGDRRATRILLDSIEKMRSDFAPGGITIDAVYGTAWLRVQLGDSAAARRALDNAFSGLSTILPNVVKSPTLAASLVRAMIFRSQLAVPGDLPAARAWGDVALQLWGNGDPALVAEVRKTLSAQKSR
jgi:serine/threonine protein kinase